MQDIPRYLPPGAFNETFDPNGPVGRLIVGEGGWTIGQQFQAGMASPFGYVVGENGTARPAYEYGLPPPGAIAAMTSHNDAEHLMGALLILMF